MSTTGGTPMGTVLMLDTPEAWGGKSPNPHQAARS